MLGLLIWAAHFGTIYAVNALACERDWAGHVSLIVAALTAAALAALALMLRAACPALRATDAHEALVEGGQEEPRFSLWLSAATAALAARAVVFQAIPAALVPACG